MAGATVTDGLGKLPAVGSENRKFYPEMESLRGLAALSVVFYHIVGQAQTSSIGFGAYVEENGLWAALYIHVLSALFNGSSAVMLFFVLSGFVMGINFKTDGPLVLKKYISFIITRAFRLLPVIPVAIVLAVGLSVFLPYVPQVSIDLSVRSLLLLEPSVDPPLWTLRVEIIVSAIYLVMLYYVRWTGLFWQLMGFLGIFWLNNHVDLGWYWSSTRVDIYLYCFYLGLIVPTFGRFLIKLLPYYIQLFFLGVSFLQYCAWGIFINYAGPLNLASQALAAFYILCWVMYAETTRTRDFLTRGAVRYVGRISYSLYALHLPIVAAVTLAMRHILADSSFLGVLVEIAGVAIALPLAIGAAHLSYFYIERPCIDLGRRIASFHVPRDRWKPLLDEL